MLYFASILLTCALTGFLAFYAWRRRSVPGSRAYARLMPAAHADSKTRALEKQAERSLAVLLFIFLLIVTSISAVGYLSYRRYESRFRAQVENQLSSIARLKAGVLEHWRKERLADAEILYRNASFSALTQRYLENPADGRAKAELQVWLDKFAAYEQYNRVFLLDARAVERLSSPAAPEPVAEHLTREAAAVLAAGQVVFLDFNRDTDEGPIHLSLLVPILAGQDGERPLGILVLRIDPYAYLYPYIRQWPTRSASAETLLVRREGTDAVFLNELKFSANSALNLRVPLKNTQRPAVKAVLGQEGIVEGLNYRGVPVIADVRAVPGSPWFLVARVDTAEAYAPLRERLWQIAFFFGALMAASGAGLGLVWRRQRVRYYQSQVGAAQALRESEERYQLANRATFNAIWDWNLQTDALWWNDNFRALFGYPSEEIEPGIESWTRRIHPEDLVRVETGIHAAIDSGRQSWADHYRFRRKDGRYADIEDRGYISRDASGKPLRMIGAIQDVTERKRAEESLAIQRRIADIFLRVPDDEMYYEVLKVILEIMQSPYGVFGYIDEAGALVVPSMTRHIGDQCQVPDKTYIFPRDTWGDSSWPTAIRERRILYSNEASAKTPAGHVAIHRHISLPILFQGEVIGLLQVANKETDYTDADLRSLEAIAGHIAPILSARLKRTRAEKSLQALLERQNALLSAVPDIIMEVDQRKVYTWANRAGIEFFGEEVLGKEAAYYFEGEQDTYGVVQPLFNGNEKVTYVESLQRRKDGEKRLLAWWCRVLKDDRGNVTGALSSARDITEQKRQEKEILAAQAELQRLLEAAERSRRALLSVVEDEKAAEEEVRKVNAELEQRIRERTVQITAANKELETFSYSVSHDLRSPLRGIDGWSLALLEDFGDKIDAQGRQFLDRIRSETQRMGQLIDDLLAFSRNTRGEMTYQAVDMTAMAQAIVLRMRQANPARRVEFAIQPGLTAHGDSRLLEVALTNLFDNAFKFSGPRPQALIEFGETDQEGQRAFFVRDNGVGFDMAYAHKLFRVFQRLHGLSEFPGTGIGLATAQRIINRHGGRVWAEAQVDRGATFYFTLQEAA